MLSTQQYSARTNIIIEREQLRHIAHQQRIFLDAQHCLRRSARLSDIIQIGGEHNPILRTGVDKTLAVGSRQIGVLLLNLLHVLQGVMTFVIEVLVLRLALAKTHQLHTTNHQFYFVIGIFYDLVEYSLGFCILHLCDVVESHVVHGVCPFL